MDAQSQSPEGFAFNEKLDDLVSKCKNLLRDSLSLVDDATSSLAWVSLFVKLNGTIREILLEYEKENLLDRCHGGIVKCDDDDDNASFGAPSSSLDHRSDGQISPPPAMDMSDPKSLKLRIRLKAFKKSKLKRPSPNKSKPKSVKLRGEPKIRKAKRTKRPITPTKCRDCDEIFTTKYSFRAHVKEHEKQWGPAHPNGVQCAVCSYRLMSKGDLRTHIRIHLPKSNEEDSYEFQCETCLAKLKTKFSFQNHLLAHAQEKAFVCEVCGFKTHNSINLKAHKMSHNARTFTCDRDGCTASFKTRNSLRSHTRTVHEKPQNHVCDQCSRSFTNSFNLQRHRLSHTGERPHLCTVCGKAFALRQHLAFHVRSVHQMDFSPQRAYKNISDGDDVTNASRDGPTDGGTPRKRSKAKPKHLSGGENATGEANQINRPAFGRPTKQPVCTQEGCGWSFNRRSELRRHMKMAHAESVAKTCEICHKICRDSGHLWDHMQTHTRPHGCNFCDAGFGKPSHLRRHMAQIHGMMHGDTGDRSAGLGSPDFAEMFPEDGGESDSPAKNEPSVSASYPTASNSASAYHQVVRPGIFLPEMLIQRSSQQQNELQNLYAQMQWNYAPAQDYHPHIMQL